MKEIDYQYDLSDVELSTLISNVIKEISSLQKQLNFHEKERNSIARGILLKRKLQYILQEESAKRLTPTNK